MKRVTACATFVAMSMLLGLSADICADDQNEDSADLTSHIAKDSVPSCIGACRVNFTEELGVPLEFLDSIGAEIHAARKAPDPVKLALCARGLAAAESVAGKQASVTAEQVMNEAIQLAKLRGYSAELAALAALVDDDIAADLSEQAEVAREAEAAEREATEKGEENKELIGTLKVINHSHECLRIYMDGQYLGTVHAHHTRNFHVHNHNWHNHFDAYCVAGNHLVQHGNYTGHAHFLTWHIHD